MGAGHVTNPSDEGWLYTCWRGDIDVYMVPWGSSNMYYIHFDYDPTGQNIIGYEINSDPSSGMPIANPNQVGIYNFANDFQNLYWGSGASGWQTLRDIAWDDKGYHNPGTYHANPSSTGGASPDIRGFDGQIATNVAASPGNGRYVGFTSGDAASSASGFLNIFTGGAFGYGATGLAPVQGGIGDAADLRMAYHSGTAGNQNPPTNSEAQDQDYWDINIDRSSNYYVTTQTLGDSTSNWCLEDDGTTINSEGEGTISIDLKNTKFEQWAAMTDNQAINEGLIDGALDDTMQFAVIMEFRGYGFNYDEPQKNWCFQDMFNPIGTSGNEYNYLDDSYLNCNEHWPEYFGSFSGDFQPDDSATTAQKQRGYQSGDRGSPCVDTYNMADYAGAPIYPGNGVTGSPSGASVSTSKSGWANGAGWSAGEVFFCTVPFDTPLSDYDNFKFVTVHQTGGSNLGPNSHWLYGQCHDGMDNDLDGGTDVDPQAVNNSNLPIRTGYDTGCIPGTDDMYEAGGYQPPCRPGDTYIIGDWNDLNLDGFWQLGESDGVADNQLSCLGNQYGGAPPANGSDNDYDGTADADDDDDDNDGICDEDGMGDGPDGIDNTEDDTCDDGEDQKEDTNGDGVIDENDDWPPGYDDTGGDADDDGDGIPDEYDDFDSNSNDNYDNDNWDGQGGWGSPYIGPVWDVTILPEWDVGGQWISQPNTGIVIAENGSGRASENANKVLSANYSNWLQEMGNNVFNTGAPLVAADALLIKHDNYKTPRFVCSIKAPGTSVSQHNLQMTYELWVPDDDAQGYFDFANGDMRRGTWVEYGKTTFPGASHLSGLGSLHSGAGDFSGWDVTSPNVGLGGANLVQSSTPSVNQQKHSMQGNFGEGEYRVKCDATIVAKVPNLSGPAATLPVPYQMITYSNFVAVEECDDGLLPVPPTPDGICRDGSGNGGSTSQGETFWDTLLDSLSAIGALLLLLAVAAFLYFIDRRLWAYGAGLVGIGGVVGYIAQGTANVDSAELWGTIAHVSIAAGMGALLWDFRGQMGNLRLLAWGIILSAWAAIHVAEEWRPDSVEDFIVPAIPGAAWLLLLIGVATSVTVLGVIFNAIEIDALD